MEWSNAGSPQDGAKLISIGLKCVISWYRLVCSTQTFTVLFKFEVHCHYSSFNSAMTQESPQNDLRLIFFHRICMISKVLKKLLCIRPRLT